MRSGLMVSGCWTEDIFRKLRPCTFGFMAMRCLELVLTAPYQRVRPQVAGQLFYNANGAQISQPTSAPGAIFFRHFIFLPKTGCVIVPSDSQVSPPPNLMRTGPRLQKIY